MSSDKSNISRLASNFLISSISNKYSYNFEWLGRPIIQYPQDIVAVQELIWKIKPDLIIETGIAHGGSLIMSASILALLDYCDAVNNSATLDPKKPNRKVLGIDIEIREHNLQAIKSHPMSSRIDMIQGSSIDPEVINEVYNYAKYKRMIMVFLDSNHTHDHVLAELNAYGPLVNAGSYCVVFDTVLEDIPEELSLDRPWGLNNNPKSAVYEYLKNHPEFEIDKKIDEKLLISVAPDGYLKKIR